MSKFHNVPRRIDGILFHSQKEAYRYVELKSMLAAGEIANLELQPRFSLDVNDVHVCDYLADFAFDDSVRKCHVVEDVKGYRTEVFKFKKRLMKACLGIEVEET